MASRRENIYADRVFGDDPDVYYVVLGYHLRLPTDVQLILPRTQHDHFRWCSLAETRSSDSVHENTRVYLLALPQANDLSKRD
ncbi:GDP-mannose mannosyl hydrolase [compost metagenome]